MPLTTAQQAKQKGWEHAGYGYWKDKSGKIVARSKNNKLVPITKSQQDRMTVDKKQGMTLALPSKATKSIDMMAKKVGDQKGSNPGGFYVGSDGVKRYVKQYKEPSKAYAEQLANTVYNELGIGAPVSHTFTDSKGRVWYASDILKNKGTLGELPPVQRKKLPLEILKGFLADVLLANWDAIGLEDDNIVVTPNGVARIDNGGSLLFRAQAGRKPEELLHDIPEWKGFANPDINPNYAWVWRNSGLDRPDSTYGKAFLKPQLAKILQLHKKYKTWDNFIEKVAPNMPAKDKKQIAKMLDARMKKLVEKFK